MLEFSNCRYNLSIKSVVVFVPSVDIMGLGHKIFTHLKAGLCSALISLYIYKENTGVCTFLLIYINTCEKLRLNNS